jgi:hypothetical protein
MKRILFFCCALILMSRMSAAQAPDRSASGAPGQVSVLASEEVKGAPRAEHVRKVLQQVASELKLVRKQMPRVIMMYVRRSDAETQQLPNVAITVEQRTTSGTTLYHVWIVDDVRDLATVQGLLMVLNDHFDLKMEPAKQQQARDHVMHSLNNTVDYHTLAEGK